MTSWKTQHWEGAVLWKVRRDADHPQGGLSGLCLVCKSWLGFLNCPTLQQQSEAGNSMGMGTTAQHDIFTGRSGGGSESIHLPHEDLVTST